MQPIIINFDHTPVEDQRYVSKFAKDFDLGDAIDLGGQIHNITAITIKKRENFEFVKFDLEHHMFPGTTAVLHVPLLACMNEDRDHKVWM